MANPRPDPSARVAPRSYRFDQALRGGNHRTLVDHTEPGVLVDAHDNLADAWWGVAWVEDTHKIPGNGILVLIGLHVGGVLLASLRHHETLVRAMITGASVRHRRKTLPDPGGWNAKAPYRYGAFAAQDERTCATRVP